MSDALLVPVAQVAQIFGLTERRVQQLASDGIIPKAERGRYHFIESVRGYIGFLQERAFGKSENSTDSHHERTRLLSAKATREELVVAELQGELLRAEEVQTQGAMLGTLLRNNLESMPDRTAPLVAAESDIGKCHDIMFGEIQNALNDIVAAMEQTEVDDARLDVTRRTALESLEKQSEV